MGYNGRPEPAAIPGPTMSEDYQPPLADYFDQMEAKYGADFSFDALSDDELLTLERLGRHAVDEDQRVTWQEKQNLAPLIALIEIQRNKRGLPKRDH